MNTGYQIKRKFNEAANKYDAQRKIFIPFLQDYYESGVNFLALQDYKNILDLGAGTGLLTKILFDRFPKANFTLVDISEEMLNRAKNRFAGHSNFHFIVDDFSQKLPNQKYDLIVSALSIHHLKAANKIKLYGAILNMLKPKGCFLNIDQYNAKDKAINKKYETLWINNIKNNLLAIKNPGELIKWKQRRTLDKETTVEKEMMELKRTGFKKVECLYKYWKFAVIIGNK